MQEGDQRVGWQYSGGKDQQTGLANQPVNKAATSSFSWTASEYIEHSKSAGWFVAYVFIVIVGMALMYLLTRDFISIFILTILAIGFVIFAARKPKELQYSISNQGITIGQKFYPMNLFKSFSVVQDGAMTSINLMPLKRFMPPISIYFAPTDGDKIVDIFGSLLPIETHKPDAVDRLMSRIRF